MKTGFVTIFGRSNVGKSTLLNALIGTKLAITSPKPQTTRNQIQGVLHTDDAQIVFVDTPGLFLGSRRQLTTYLNNRAQAALKDVDAIVHVVDPTRAIGPEDKRIFALLRDVSLPKILVINKIDTHRPAYLAAFEAQGEAYDAVVQVSAKTGQHLKALIQALVNVLPEGEGYYQRDQITNLNDTFWFAELIREKLFLRLQEELPYALTVNVDEIVRRKDGTLYVRGQIITADSRYRGMILGQGGRGLREIGQSARKELEAVIGGKVYLDLQVEVDPHWTDQFK